MLGHTAFHGRHKVLIFDAIKMRILKRQRRRLIKGIVIVAGGILSVGSSSIVVLFSHSICLLGIAAVGSRISLIITASAQQSQRYRHDQDLVHNLFHVYIHLFGGKQHPILANQGPLQRLPAQ